MTRGGGARGGNLWGGEVGGWGEVCVCVCVCVAVGGRACMER